MIFAGFLFLIGMSLSALFSGSETGFYRVTRWRLVLESRKGDRIARGLLWLANNPSLFVATTLVGNNLANYIVSYAIVLGTGHLLGEGGVVVELLASVLISPFVYVYGESLPKSLFYHAPNQLLRRGGPLFLICSLVFAPMALVLWGLARVLQRLAGESPERVKTIIARRELERVLEEGHAAGLLRPTQRLLSQSIFTTAQIFVTEVMSPVARTPISQSGMTRDEMLALGAWNEAPIVPVLESQGGEFSGYLRMSDLALSNENHRESLLPLLDLTTKTTCLDALVQMQSGNYDMARVIDEKNQTVGFLQTRKLVARLLSGEWS